MSFEYTADIEEKYTRSTAVCGGCNKVRPNCKCGTIEGYISNKTGQLRACFMVEDEMLAAIPNPVQGVWSKIWDNMWKPMLEKKCRSCIFGLQRLLKPEFNCAVHKYEEWETIKELPTDEIT